MRSIDFKMAGLSRAAAWIAVLGPWLAGPGAALAVDLGDMAEEAAGALGQVPLFLQIVLYLVGAILVFLGLLKFKRHVDYPQQANLGAAMMTVAMGVALIIAPALINTLIETVGLDAASGTVTRPSLQ